jgi:predicted alpha-1,2-mannosidase
MTIVKAFSVALILISVSFCLRALPAAAQEDGDGRLTAWVDPFIGVDGGSVIGGNTVPGPGLPFGFVSLSPDTANGDTNGYDSDSAILGFSHTHVSGTGGLGKYGNFRVTPTVGPRRANQMIFAKSAESASPGYYAVTLGNDPARAVRVELTASNRVGYERFTFPKGQQANVMLDLTSVVAFRGSGQRATEAHVDIISDRALSGWASFTGGWNPAPYTLYFYAEFDRPARQIGSWIAAQGSYHEHPGTGALEGGDQRKTDADKLGPLADFDTRQEFAHKLGAYASFDADQTPVVEMKLAVSFLGCEKAKANLAREIPGWRFTAVKGDAERIWNDTLSRIVVKGGTPDQRRIFYTALYHSHTMPHDLSGENVWWTSPEPHYEDFYTLWDTFRTLHPLLTLIQPDRQRGIVRSLIDTYLHTGWLPDGRSAGANGLTQGGSNGDVVLADAIVKRLGGFDAELAYQAMRKDADIETDQPFLQGRVLTDYLALGYVSLTQPRSASRTLEYAYDDFTLSEVAAILGHREDAERYLARSGGWKKLWDDELGCIHPRYSDGSGLENFTCVYDYPDRSMPWWDAPFYEGNALQYSTFVPGDISGLMAKVGGPDRFVAWLDRLFDQGYYSAGNEPDILAPYLYINAGRPDRTADRVRSILAHSFLPDRHGLPGNDDAGAMSSWYVLSAIGLYPNAGQPYYYVGSPIFEESRIDLGQGRSFMIRAPGTSDRNRYVRSARLNGEPLNRAWLSHDEVMRGGVLDLEMGAEPGNWGTKF